MSNTALVVPELETPQVHLVARNPNEMASAKKSLLMWLTQKITVCDTETEDLGKAAEQARKNKWNHSALDRHCNLAKRRADFYRKAKLAVEAGYTIVPNFPIDLFAVRVKKQNPSQSLASNSTWKSSGTNPSGSPEPESLPAGEGRYVSGTTVTGISGSYKEKNAKGEDITKYFFNPTDFAEVAFPIEAARPEVMSASAEAMALRCFDAIGICGGRKQDPLIIGQIRGPKVGYNYKTISFLIAWHLDLRTL